MTLDDLVQVYNCLYKQYPIRFTSTLQVDDGFTEDMPIIVGQHAGIAFWLYLYEGEFVFSYEVPGQTHHDHCHPLAVSEAVQRIISFMEAR